MFHLFWLLYLQPEFLKLRSGRLSQGSDLPARPEGVRWRLSQNSTPNYLSRSRGLESSLSRHLVHINKCLSVYICIYLCIYIYMCMYLYVYIYIYIYMYM